MDIEKILSEYDYEFPEELIAKSPASPRESARLLSYSKKDDSMRFDTFAELPDLLPKNSLIVFNETKVVPAKITLHKDTGGAFRVICIGVEEDLIKVMSDRKLNIGSVVTSVSGVSFDVARQDGRYYFLRPLSYFTGGKNISLPEFYGFLSDNGETPLPPYIKNSPLSEKDLREEYQSVFAMNEGSIAAPTASLHFTDDLITRLKEKGHECCFVTLHVGLGTFATLSEKNIAEKKLHEEQYDISEETASMISRAKKEGRPVIAVGTTALRALESSADEEGNIVKPSGTTDLFITEGYHFRIVNGLVTNFHVPRSSLLMLVSALIGRKKIMELYGAAIGEKMRLFSFGDGMLIKDLS